MYLTLLLSSKSLSITACAKPADHACCCIEPHTSTCPSTRPKIKGSYEIISSLTWRKEHKPKEPQEEAAATKGNWPTPCCGCSGCCCFAAIGNSGCTSDSVRMTPQAAIDRAASSARSRSSALSDPLIVAVARLQRSRGPTEGATTAAGTKTGAVALKGELITGSPCCG